MANDVFLELAHKLENLPDQVENALITATKQAVKETGEKMEANLKKGAQQTEEGMQLADHQLVPNIIDDGKVYSYQIDWSPQLVNKPNAYFAKKPRLPGKRNFSIAPATWHDLAYIIDAGWVEPASETGIKIVPGTNFIKKARRNAKIWKKKRDIYATAELQIVANNLDKE